MSDTPPKRTIQLAGEEVEVNFSLASLFFLTSKHPDLPAFLETLGGTGQMNPEGIKSIAEMIYAGLIRPDDDGNDTSGWSVGRVMGSVHPSELGALSTQILAAFTEGGRKVDPPQ